MTMFDEWREQNSHMRRRILGDDGILQRAAGRWSSKNLDYGGQQMFLGLKAQFADINRKFWKLYQAVWLDQPPVHEPTVEICEDMIGHLLMMIYFLEDREQTPAEAYEQDMAALANGELKVCGATNEDMGATCDLHPHTPDRFHEGYAPSEIGFPLRVRVKWGGSSG